MRLFLDRNLKINGDGICLRGRGPARRRSSAFLFAAHASLWTRPAVPRPSDPERVPPRRFLFCPPPGAVPFGASEPSGLAVVDYRSSARTTGVVPKQAFPAEETPTPQKDRRHGMKLETEKAWLDLKIAELEARAAWLRWRIAGLRLILLYADEPRVPPSLVEVNADTSRSSSPPKPSLH